MAAVFSALDRSIYQRLIPQHLADLLCFPKEVMQHLQKGAFTVHLSEGNGHAVGLDEAHEMKINKDAKFSVVRPSPEIMNRISNLMPFRAQCLNSLKKHLDMEIQLPSNVPKSTSRDRVADGNVQVMLDMMEECEMMSHVHKEPQLRNPFTGTIATPEQMHDLLNLHEIGQAAFEDHVNYRILRTSSADAPCRRRRLQTFSSTKKNKKKLKQIDRERKILQTCLKKQLVVLTRGEQLPPECGSYFLPHPCALCDFEGYPHKGNKSKATDFFETRYKKINVIVSTFPGTWTPQSVILEGMFMIQTSPSPGLSNFQEYTKMLKSD